MRIKRSGPSSYVGIGCLTILLAVAVWLLYPILMDSWRPCHSIFAYGDIDAPVYEIDTFNGSRGIRQSIRAGNYHDCSLLGFDTSHRAWVFIINGLAASSAFRWDLVLYQGKTKTEVILKDLPITANWRHARLFNGDVYIPSIENKTLAIYRYTLAGKLRSRRILRVPGSGIDDADTPSVAANGDIALTVRLTGGDPYTCIFDKHGRIVTQIMSGCPPLEGGYSPQLSRNGSALAYWGDNDNIVILDLRSGHRRIVPIWPPTNARAWDLLIAPVGFRWDEKNEWLICAYASAYGIGDAVYAADIRSSTIHWKRLPLRVDLDSWVLLDKMP